MKGIFAVLHARAICHATEDLDKVKSTLENTFGKTEIDVSQTEGHHGNPIIILEVVTRDIDVIDGFFSRLNDSDIDEILASLRSRMDDGCNLFIRIDKQAAFNGDIRLGRSDDVISVRIQVRTFPSKYEIASSAVREYFEDRRPERTQDVTRTQTL